MADRRLEVRSDIGPFLRQLREEHTPPLTQKNAAALVGADLRNWGSWERGQARPRLDSILRISDAFNVSPQDFLQRTTPEDTPERTSATRADFLRLETKVDQLLDHFNLDRDLTPAQVADEIEKAIPQPADTPPRHAPKRQKRTGSSSS